MLLGDGQRGKPGRKHPEHADAPSSPFIGMIPYNEIPGYLSIADAYTASY
jgi:hypothetical protein